MRRILCLAVVMSALSGPALAGMSEGVAAVTVGDYQKAIAEFQPLAAGGDPAAQYQLAKIYLEGHGPADGLAQGIDWSAAPSVTVAPYDVRYVVERLCSVAAVTDVSRECLVPVASPLARQFRITVRVTMASTGTTTFVQALMQR